MASAIATLLAIPLGILAAVKQDTWVDYAVRVFSIAGLATPSFWLGSLMILSMLIFFKWVPPMVFTPLWVNPWENLAQLIWPALAVGYRYCAVGTRMMRSTMLEVLREDYIRTARAKGLWLKLILTRHALKNAILPVLTVISLEFAFLLGGLVVTEQVFNLNGLGMLFVEAISHRDYTLTQALVLLVATVVPDRQLRWSTSPTPGSIRASATAEPWPSHRRRSRTSTRADAKRAGWIAAVLDFVAPVPARRGRRRDHPGDGGARRDGAGGSRRTTRSRTTTPRCSPRRAPSTGSAPTPSAATCSRASSTARAPR